MNIGKRIRFERLVNRRSRKMILVPMDHGVSAGPISGLVNLSDTIDKVARGGANAIVLHKGMVDKGHRESGIDIGLIIHLSASTDIDEKNSLTKHLVCTVKEAIQIGADGVSVHVNLGPDSEGKMLEDLGQVAEQCKTWGMPLMAMIYPRYFDPAKPKGQRVVHNISVQTVAHSARLAAELGADIVKVPIIPDVKEFAKVIEGAAIPVVIAGGSKLPAKEMLKLVETARLAGASGLSVGRNVFQAKKPDELLKAFGAIFHDGISAKEAEKML